MITDYLRNALLNHALGVQQFTMPATVWAALYLSPPQQSGTLPLIIDLSGVNGVEVTASDYQRIATSWRPAAAGIITNATSIQFPAVGTTVNEWGTVSSVGLLDSSVGGNLLFFGPLSADVILATGTDFQIAAGSLAITLLS